MKLDGVLKVENNWVDCVLRHGLHHFTMSCVLLQAESCLASPLRLGPTTFDSLHVDKLQINTDTSSTTPNKNSY